MLETSWPGRFAAAHLPLPGEQMQRPHSAADDAGATRWRVVHNVGRSAAPPGPARTACESIADFEDDR